MADTVILIDTDIDVISKQRELVTEALGPDGTYIRLKETLEELFSDGSVKGPERAQLIANTMAQMVNGITSSSMQIALQWAAQEKELYLKKEELEYKIDLMKLEAEKAEQDAASAEANKHLLQAKLLREYGVKTVDSNGDLVALDDSGLIYEQIRGVVQDTANKALMPEQIQAQTDEVQARTHKLVADTYVNHGLFTGYTINGNGIANATKVNTGYVTLSDMNKQVAKEQAKGYAWNAWSSSASSSAGMIGTLVASEVAELVDDAQNALTNWTNAVTKLNAVQEPSISI